MFSVCIYMVLIILSACLFGFVQTLGKVYVSEWSSILATGSSYRYNYVIYFIGLVLFLASMNILYRIFLKKKLEITPFNSHEKTASVILVIFGCLVMFIALLIGSMALLGMTDHLVPNVLFYITLIGWPVVTMIYMLVKLSLNM